MKGITLILLTAILLSGCSKSTDSPAADDVVTLMQSGDWKITGVTISPAFYGVTHYLATLPPCERDNLFQFRGAGAFYHDEGATKCATGGPQRDTGTWRYDSKDKVLRFFFTSGTNKNATGKNDNDDYGSWHR